MIENDFARTINDLVARVGGPMSFRFLVQPAVAITYAIIDGVRDAKSGKPAYFWALLSDPAHRRERLMELWTSLAKVLVLVAVLDLIYEVVVLKSIYIGQTLIVVLVVAVLPYMLLRGPVNRLIRLFSHDAPRDES